MTTGWRSNSPQEPTLALRARAAQRPHRWQMGSRSAVPISASWRAVLVLISASLAFIGYRSFLLGYALAEHLEGQKLGGIMEGDWFFVFGLVGLAVAGFWAIRTLLWAILGKRHRQDRKSGSDGLAKTR